MLVVFHLTLIKFTNNTLLANTYLHIRYTGELPYPQLSLTSSSPPHIQLGTHGMNTPNTCSVVLVAGSALYELQSVKSTVDSMAQQMMKIPYVMVLLVDNPNVKLNTQSRPMDPAMVSCQLQTNYTIPYHTILTRYRWISIRLDHFTQEEQTFNISAKESQPQAS